MDTATHSEAPRVFATRYVNRRRLLGGALAAAGAGTLLGFSFRRTPEIEAQQRTGDSLYDQLGGMIGITTIVTTVGGIIGADERINFFFADTVASGGIPRLLELLSQQLAELTGGPVRYTGRDMRTAHAGRGITADHFFAILEDFALAAAKSGVAEGPATMLLDALQALGADIVDIR